MAMSPSEEEINDTNAKIAEDEALEEWLPITSSRDAKWWYSAFHNVTAMIGAGVLSLPYALSELGWGPGITLLTLSWIITLYTLWQMVEMHEMIPGKRLDRYHELGQHVFGEKRGLYIVVPQQLIVQIGTSIAYMITGGKCLQKFQQSVCSTCKPIKTTYFIMIFSSVHFFLAHFPNFNSISGFSLSAAVMSICYTTVAWIASLMNGVYEDVDYGLRERSKIANFFNFLAALGGVAFAFSGHSVVLEIQATIPSTPGKPSKIYMWKGVVIAYIVVAFCYFPLAIIGYYIYGNSVDDNILVTLEKPTWLIAAANMFVVVHVIGGYQVYSMPVFDMIEIFLVKQMKFQRSFRLRFIIRTLYVGITMFIGITFPFFDYVLGYLGSVAFAPLSYFLPCIMWLKIHNPKKYSLSWWSNKVCIVFGVLLMILALIGGIRTMVVLSTTYHFYT